MNRLLILPLLLALLPGCPQRNEMAADTPATPSADTPRTASGLETELARYHWRLQAATDAAGKRIDALFVRADKPLQLDFKNDRVGIANSCNRIGGVVTVRGETLVLGDMQSTLMACSDAKLTALDGEISKRLEGPLAYTLAESEPPQLRLRNGAGDQLLFAAEPTAATRYGSQGSTLFLEVAAQRAPCAHPLIRDMQCLQVRELQYDAQGIKRGAAGSFEPLYQEIEGYTHTPGIRNVLRVTRYRIANAPADAPRDAYVLDTVVESESVAR